MRKRRWRVSALIFVLALTLGLNVFWTPTIAFAAEKDRPVNFETVDEVFQLIQNLHLSAPSEEALAMAALEGITRSLNDPYTRYITDGEMNRMIGLLSGKPYDPGFSVIVLEDKVYVSDVYPGSPAEKAGIKQGDRIKQVEGNEVSADNVYTLFHQSMEGKQEGDTIGFGTERNGTASLISVTLEAYDVPLVQSTVIGKTGYIRLLQFTLESAAEFEEQLKALQRQGIHSLIFDIRDNPGGMLDAMQQVAGLFIGKDVIAYSKDSDGRESVIRGTKEKIWDSDKNVYLLVNEHSASCSDLLAAAMKDQNEAILVGTTTYGKGISQLYLPILGSSGMLAVTTTEYLSPDKHVIHNKGVEPDYEADGPLVSLIQALRMSGETGMSLSLHDYGLYLNDLRLLDDPQLHKSKGEYYVPARTLAALAGGSLSWNEAKGGIDVTVSKQTNTFGKDEGFLIINGTGFLNLRMFSKAFPSVSYEADGDTFTIKAP